MTYYIYEIPGIKNGATIDFKGRSRHNFNKYGVQAILIETMEGPDVEEFWQVVGDREWELAVENGYPRGQHYRQMRIKVFKSLECNLGRVKAGAIAGPVNGIIAGKSQRHITYQQAQEIISKWNAKEKKFGYRKVLAEEYNCGPGIIGGITSGKTYLTP
tara:strand:+ start:88 stop:564 length:477 start_codon:yes stop_codon:yes gene_type:complete